MFFLLAPLMFVLPNHLSIAKRRFMLQLVPVNSITSPQGWGTSKIIFNFISKTKLFQKIKQGFQSRLSLWPIVFKKWTTGAVKQSHTTHLELSFFEIYKVPINIDGCSGPYLNNKFQSHCWRKIKKTESNLGYLPPYNTQLCSELGGLVSL